MSFVWDVNQATIFEAMSAFNVALFLKTAPFAAILPALSVSLVITLNRTLARHARTITVCTVQLRTSASNVLLVTISTRTNVCPVKYPTLSVWSATKMDCARSV